jgi:hypothetical protein
MANVKAILASVLVMLVSAPFFGAGLAYGETENGSAPKASQVVNGDNAGITATLLDDGRWQLVGMGLSLTAEANEWSRERYSFVSAAKVAETDSVEVTLSRNGQELCFRTLKTNWLEVLPSQAIYRDRLFVRTASAYAKREYFTVLTSADAPHYQEHNVGGLAEWPTVAAAKPSQQVAFTGTPTPRQGGGVVLKVEESSEAKAVHTIADGVKNGTIFIGKPMKKGLKRK